MDSESKFAEQQEAPERSPSQEEISGIFESITNGRQHKEPKILSNEEGVYIYEIEVPLENGEMVECNYQRANYNYQKLFGRYPSVSFASIHLYQYDAGGTIISGKKVADYADGAWRFYPEEIQGIF